MRHCTYELKNALQGPPGATMLNTQATLLYHASTYSPRPIGRFRAHDAIILIIHTFPAPTTRGLPSTKPQTPLYRGCIHVA